MKKVMTVGLLSATALLVVACGQSTAEKNEMFAQCKIVLGDRTLSPDMRAAGTSPDAACTCLGATLNRDDDGREDVQTFFSRVAGRMAETDENAREAVDNLVSGSLLSQDGDKDHAFTDTLSTFNTIMNEMLGEMGENNGTCPAI